MPSTNAAPPEHCMPGLRTKATTAATPDSLTSSARGATSRASLSVRTPSCRWPSNSARRSISTGAKRASGWEKGVVEKNVQDSRRRIWIDAGKQRFGSFTELNAWIAERCRSLWTQVRHPEHDQFSVAEMLEHERAHLMPMPEPFDGYVEKPARVSSTCLVSVARNRYWVPCELAGQMISARLYPGSGVVVADDAVVARHERLSDSGQTRYDWQHYIPLLQRKPGALRNGAPFADMPNVGFPSCCHF